MSDPNDIPTFDPRRLVTILAVLMGVGLIIVAILDAAGSSTKLTVGLIVIGAFGATSGAVDIWKRRRS